MIVPVRCFTCGKVVGNLWEKFLEQRQEGVDPRVILDKLGLERYCCRRMIMSNVELIDQLLEYRIASDAPEPMHDAAM